MVLSVVTSPMRGHPSDKEHPIIKWIFHLDAEASIKGKTTLYIEASIKGKTTVYMQMLFG